MAVGHASQPTAVPQPTGRCGAADCGPAKETASDAHPRLRQVVGLRTLAPYREDDGRRARPNYGKLRQLQAEAGLLPRDAKARKKQRKAAGAERPAWPRVEREQAPGAAAAPGPTPAPDPQSAAADAARGGSAANGPAAAQPALGTKRKKAARRLEEPGSAGGAERTGAGAHAAKHEHEKPAQGQKRGWRGESVAGGWGQGDEGEGAGAGAPAAKKKKRKGEQPAHLVEGGQQPQGRGTAVDAAAMRLQTFARPTLRRPEAPGAAGKKKRKRVNGEGPQQAVLENGAGNPAGSLTKAQRKNLKRQQKRAARREAKA